MIYVTSICPHCKSVIKVMQPKGERQYGSPLRTCQSCNGHYIDKSFIEISLEERAVDNLPFSPIWVLNIILGALSVYVGITEPDNLAICIPLALLFGGSGIYFIIQEILHKDEHEKFLEQEMIESKKRMSNSEYAKFLRDNDIF